MNIRGVPAATVRNCFAQDMLIAADRGQVPCRDLSEAGKEKGDFNFEVVLQNVAHHSLSAVSLEEQAKWSSRS